MYPSSDKIEEAMKSFAHEYDIAVYTGNGAFNPEAITGAELLTSVQKENIMERINAMYRKR